MDIQEQRITPPAARSTTVLTPRFLLGAGVLVFGIVLLLDSLKLVEADRVLRFWPVVLIAIGLFKLLLGSSTPSRVFGGVVLVFGTLMLLSTLHRIEAGLVFPLALVLLGGWLVFRAFGTRTPRAGTLDDPSQTMSVFAMMAGVERKATSKAFRGGDATALMGGCEVDLRDASIEGEAVMDVFAMWGGIEITVPGDWTVVNTATPIMGGVEDTRKTVGSDPNKRFVLRGLVLMGGVEIKN